MRSLRSAGVALTLVVLSACSSGAPTSGGSTTAALAAARSSTAAACVLVQQADAEILFGRKATRVEVKNTAHADSVCGYSANSNADAATIDNVVDSLLVYVFDGTAHFTKANTSDATPVAGLGDGAFEVTRGDLVSVSFMANGQSVEIDHSITGLGTHPTAAASTAQLVELARTATTRM